MTTIIVPISEDRLEQLKAIARDAGITAEDLARASLEEWLASPRQDFAAAAERVVHKNMDLYRRLSGCDT